MATLHHQVWINSSVSKVYAGLATAEGLGRWWAPHTSTKTAAGPASAWTGTHLIFEITERENPGHWLGISDGGPRLAVVEFRHSGWNEDSEYFGFCNFAWGETLLTLKQWCESRNA